MKHTLLLRKKKEDPPVTMVLLNERYGREAQEFFAHYHEATLVQWKPEHGPFGTYGMSEGVAMEYEKLLDAKK